MSIGFLTKNNKEITQTIESLTSTIMNVDPKAAILLFGSVAKGTASWNSDIDIMVISDAFGENWFERHEKIYKLFKGGIDIFLYTFNEFRQMIEQRHGLLLEALTNGIVLNDNSILINAKKLIEDLVTKRKIIRVDSGWKINE